MSIIKEAYENCDKKFDNIPIIDVDPFREELSNEYSSNFPLNKPGDPQKFLKYWNTLLYTIEGLGSEKPKVLDSALQIYTLNSLSKRDTVLEPEPFGYGSLKFTANKIIPFIENCNKNV